jgi:hypothetical protein
MIGTMACEVKAIIAAMYKPVDKPKPSMAVALIMMGMSTP